MNHPSEWKKIYHPRSGRFVYKHKGTDSLMKIGEIGKAMKKPFIGVLKKTAKKVAEKGINKASDVVVKKAGDKIGNILRKRPTKTTLSTPKKWGCKAFPIKSRCTGNIKSVNREFVIISLKLLLVNFVFLFQVK